jgi:hypothetical protein
MPTTTRVNIASNVPITQTIDDVLVSQYGRHDTVALAAGVAQTIPWPATAETGVYIRFPGGTNTVTIKAVATDATGWVITIPAVGFVPIMLGKPSTGNIILNATAAISIVDLYFF